MYDVALSDHYLVEMNLNITKHEQPSKYTVKQCLCNIDIDAFKDLMRSLDKIVNLAPSG